MDRLGINKVVVGSAERWGFQEVEAVRACAFVTLQYHKGVPILQGEVRAVEKLCLRHGRHSVEDTIGMRDSPG